MVGVGVVWQMAVEGTRGGMVLLGGPGWGGGEGGRVRSRGETGRGLWENRRWGVLWVGCCVWIGGGGVVGHGFGGPHASEDHLPGVAQSGAGAELGGGAQSSARPDELQLDRAGGNCSISGTQWHRHRHCGTAAQNSLPSQPWSG